PRVATAGAVAVLAKAASEDGTPNPGPALLAERAVTLAVTQGRFPDADTLATDAAAGRATAATGDAVFEDAADTAADAEDPAGAIGGGVGPGGVAGAGRG